MLLALLFTAFIAAVLALSPPGTVKARTRATAGFLGAIAILVLAPTMAHAQELNPGDSLGEIRLSAATVSLLLATVIPVITGLLTRITVASSVKGVITLALNFVASGLTNALMDDGSAVLSRETLIQAVVGFVVSVAAYSGILKQANITSSTVDGKLKPNSGVV